MTSQTSLMFLLCLLWVAMAIQCGLAVNGYLTEKLHGMRISRARVLVVVCTFIAATALAAFAALFPQQSSVSLPQAVAESPAVAMPAQDRTQLDIARKQMQQADQQLAAAEQSEKTAREVLDNAERKFQSPSIVVKLERVPRFDRMVLAVAAMGTLLLAGFIVLAVGGQVQTLFPEGWSIRKERNNQERASAEQDLREVTELVWNEKYREALAKGEAIAEKQLGNFDRLDLLFLRGYSTVQIRSFPEEDETLEQLEPMLDRAITDLETVVDKAPKRSEALYVLALAYGLRGSNAEAVAAFDKATPMLTTDKLPFDHNVSVCLLKLAETSLKSGDTNEAEILFRRVAELGKLSDAVAQSRLRVGMINLRGALSRQELANASTFIEELNAMTGLKDEQRAQVGAVRSILNASLALRRGDAETALTTCAEFLTKHLPAGLPAPDSESADETFSPVLDADLPCPREVFLGVFLVQAVSLSRIETKGRHKLSETQIAKLGEPLLRALQFAPRQRDALGALGGLYYWFYREKREKAREWLESAVMMGAGGRIIRAILERDRLIEMERREALDWFRSASSRFLRDPTIAAQVRSSLIEELGRFQEFEPMLISMREQPEIEPEEPTIEVLKERARYLADLVAGFARRGNSERFTHLAQIHAEYTACLASLEHASQTMATIESKVFGELGDTLLLT